MAHSVPKKVDPSISKYKQATHSGSHFTEYVLSWWEIVRGILPSLRYMISRDNNDFDVHRSKKIRLIEGPDTHLNEAQNGIDPYGNDYFCNICSHELANTYFHCQGCESLLAKDFNICIGCYNDGSYKINVEMHKHGTTAMACHFHHVGKPNKQCSNPSKHNMKCTECNKCLLCHCTCHTIFQKRCRFYTKDRQREMLERCEQLINGCDIKYSRETEYQLCGKPMSPRVINVDADNDVLTDTTPCDPLPDIVNPGSEYIAKQPKTWDVYQSEKAKSKVGMSNKIFTEGESNVLFIPELFIAVHSLFFISCLQLLYYLLTWQC